MLNADIPVAHASFATDTKLALLLAIFALSFAFYIIIILFRRCSNADINFCIVIPHFIRCRFWVSNFVESSFESSFQLLEFLLDEILCDINSMKFRLTLSLTLTLSHFIE